MSRFRILRTLHFVTLSAIVALSLSPLSAQMVGGTIAGTVVDPSNGTLDQVKVVIRNEETGTERNLTTSGDGAFSAPSIPVGVYSVSAQKDGFAPLKRTGIAVVVGQTVQVRLVLTVGKIQQVVTVVDTPAAVDTSTLQTQGFVGERQVKELPSMAGALTSCWNSIRRRSAIRRRGREGRNIELFGRKYVHDLRAAAAGQFVPAEWN